MQSGKALAFTAVSVMKRKVYMLGVRLVLERGPFFAYTDLVKEEQRETCLQVIQTFSCKTTLGSASFMRKANG